MNTTKCAAAGKRPKAAVKQKQAYLLRPQPKLTVAMSPEEHLLTTALARVVAQPGQTLTKQDVLRIALANLGLLHRKKLTAGTDLQPA